MLQGLGWEVEASPAKGSAGVCLPCSGNTRPPGFACESAVDLHLRFYTG